MSNLYDSLYPTTKSVAYGPYKINFGYHRCGYYAVFKPYFSDYGHDMSLYIRSDGSLADNMVIDEHAEDGNHNYGYCSTLKQIKMIVSGLFPGVVEKTDFSPLE